jgi:hypothetical protein
MLCPKCRSDHAHRSHRQGWFENLAGLFWQYPYRCSHCGHRFLHHYRRLRARSDTGDDPVARHRSIEREIRTTRQAKDWPRKRRDLLIVAAAALMFLGFLYLLTREPPPSTDDSFAAPPARIFPQTASAGELPPSA